MAQLAELDKMGQEGAKPVDEAEVATCRNDELHHSCIVW